MGELGCEKTEEEVTEGEERTKVMKERKLCKTC